MFKYYWFCIRWLWNNRTWQNTRQKFKAMEIERRAKSEGQLHRV